MKIVVETIDRMRIEPESDSDQALLNVLFRDDDPVIEKGAMSVVVDGNRENVEWVNIGFSSCHNE